MSAPVTVKQPWQLTEAVRPLTEYAPSIAVTVVHKPVGGDYAVLVGVRTEAANSTHPNVISVPTRRISVPLGQDWLDRIGQAPDALDDDPDLLREVENLLARKLGVADALETGALAVRVLAVGVWQGTSVIGEDEHGGMLTEDLTMFNVCVEVVDGADAFPEKTASYAPIVWPAVGDFLRMVESRDVGAANAGLDEVLFCVYGLCLGTAVRTLAMLPEVTGAPADTRAAQAC